MRLETVSVVYFSSFVGRRGGNRSGGERGAGTDPYLTSGGTATFPAITGKTEMIKIVCGTYEVGECEQNGIEGDAGEERLGIELAGGACGGRCKSSRFGNLSIANMHVLLQFVQ